jgi:hypothetical protein
MAAVAIDRRIWRTRVVVFVFGFSRWLGLTVAVLMVSTVMDFGGLDEALRWALLAHVRLDHKILVSLM